MVALFVITAGKKSDMNSENPKFQNYLTKANYLLTTTVRSKHEWMER